MKACLLFIVLAMMCIIPVIAQTVPAAMTYQGRLTDANGNAVPDGTGYEVEVRLWSASTGGTLLWGTRYAGVPLKGGAFSLILGSGGTAMPGAAFTDLKQAFTSNSVYLGITPTKTATGAAIPSPTEILPRQQFFSTAFAFRADKADKAEDSSKLGNQPATYYSPTGSIVAFAGQTAPEGWLICNGASITTTAYPALFAVLGTRFGSDGAGTFKLPNLSGRFPLGVNPAGSGTERVLAQQGGAETHTLTIAEMPAHGHNELYKAAGASSNVGNFAAGQTFASSAWRGLRSSDFDTTATGGIQSEGGGQPHNNMPPFLVLNYIIKY